MAPKVTTPPPPVIVVTPPVAKKTVKAAPAATTPKAVAPDYNTAKAGQSALHHGDTAPVTAGKALPPGSGISKDQQEKWSNFVNGRPGPLPDFTVDDPAARKFVGDLMKQKRVTLSTLLDRAPMGGAQRDLIAHFGARRPSAEVAEAVTHVLENPAKFPNGLSLIGPMVEEAAMQAKVGKNPVAAQAAFNGLMDKTLAAIDKGPRNGTSLDTLRHMWKGAASEIDAYGQHVVQDFAAKMAKSGSEVDGRAIESISRENVGHIARLGTKEMLQLSHQLEQMSAANPNAFGGPNAQAVMLGTKLLPPSGASSDSDKAYDYTNYKYEMSQITDRANPYFQKTFSEFVTREPGLEAGMRTAHSDYSVKLVGGDMEQQKFEQGVIEGVFVQGDLLPPASP